LFLEEEECNVNDVILTDNEATRTTLVRTRSALHEDTDEGENVGLKATMASRT